MRVKIKRFYRSEKDFRRFYFLLKQMPCPHCKEIGSLILHGYLYGYDEKVYGKRIIRGRRIFCSNRRRRKGCGRTFSLLKSNMLKGFNIGAESFWRFLRGIVKGRDKIQAFRHLRLSFSNTTVYRLWKRFSQCQSRIRTHLFTRHPPPKLLHVHSPAIQTILHLKSVFKRGPCPICAFQECFQMAFL